MKIAIVDDEVMITDTLKDLIQLERDDWVVHTFLNGNELLSHLKSELVDVVISDMNMPIIDGEKLLTTINKDYDSIFLIAMSGYPEMLTGLKTKIPKINLINKPFYIEDVLNTITTIESTKK